MGPKHCFKLPVTDTAMSHMLGLCCCKSCEDCQKRLRVRMPSCLGGGEGGEEEQQPQQQQGAVTQEPSSSSSEGAIPPGAAGAAAAAGLKLEVGSSYSDTSSTISEDSWRPPVRIPPARLPPTDSPQPGPSGMSTVSVDMVKNPSYTTSEDSETPP
ncbi:uncharacterized protein [Dermacentor andersoni]|uniref:uncharacterized protein n=1 Tax=Dermacentor andersoni TaxID=34620 RepID=UPI003B3B9F01